MLRQKQLRLIEKNLNSWRSGKRMRSARLYKRAMLLCSTGLLFGAVCKSESLFFLGMVPTIGFFIAWICAESDPDTWEEQINQQLMTYSPQDKAAFNKLCQTVNERRAITPEDLTAWIESEKEAIALFIHQSAERGSYSFTKRLEAEINNGGGNETERRNG